MFGGSTLEAVQIVVAAVRLENQIEGNRIEEGNSLQEPCTTPAIALTFPEIAQRNSLKIDRKVHNPGSPKQAGPTKDKLHEFSSKTVDDVFVQLLILGCHMATAFGFTCGLGYVMLSLTDMQTSSSSKSRQYDTP